MELSYLRVPTDLEDGEILSSGFSPKRSSRGFIRKIFRKLNLNRFGGVTERVLLVIMFFVFFTCFIYTLLSVFTGGDTCFAYQQGLDRLRAERDRLREELERLAKP